MDLIHTPPAVLVLHGSDPDTARLLVQTGPVPPGLAATSLQIAQDSAPHLHWSITSHIERGADARTAANAHWVGAAQADRGQAEQHHVGAIPCRCGHRRAGHRSYYWWSGTTRCVEDRDCGCTTFTATPAAPA